MLQRVEAPQHTESDQIYVLPVSILDTHKELVAEFQTLSRTLDIALGWHYILDLVGLQRSLGSLPNPVA